MLLMVSASAATSPFDFTVRFCLRSPSATAVTTLTMPRTCSVRLPAMKLTVSVRSFQVPATPGTCGLAAELAFGADLARHARHFGRRTSVELIHHRVDGVLQLEDFALHVHRDLARQVARAPRPSSPRRCCAPGWSGCAAMEVDACRSGPSTCRPTPGTSAWPPSVPSVPTSRATRVTSAANERSWSTIVLMVSFSSRISPRHVHRDLLRQVAAGDRRRHLGDVAHLRRSGCRPSKFTRVRSGPSTCRRRPAPRPGRRACLRCPPRAPRASPRPRTSVSWSTIVLMVSFSSRISPFTSTVIFFDRSPLATAVVTSAMLRTWPVRLPAIEFTESVKVLPRAGDAGHVGLAAELAFGAHLARHARHLGRRTTMSWSTIVLMVSLSSRISPFTSTVIFFDRSPRADRRGHLGDVAHLGRQVAGHRVHACR